MRSRDTGFYERERGRERERERERGESHLVHREEENRCISWDIIEYPIRVVVVVVVVAGVGGKGPV